MGQWVLYFAKLYLYTDDKITSIKVKNKTSCWHPMQCNAMQCTSKSLYFTLMCKCTLVTVRIILQQME